MVDQSYSSYLATSGHIRCFDVDSQWEIPADESLENVLAVLAEFLGQLVNVDGQRVSLLNERLATDGVEDESLETLTSWQILAHPDPEVTGPVVGSGWGFEP